MKKIIIMCLLVTTTIVIIGCDNVMSAKEREETTRTTTGLTAEQNIERQTEPDTITPEMLREVEDSFHTKMKNLNSNEIIKIKLEYFYPYGSKVYYTTDKQQIEKWVCLFQSVKIVAKPYEMIFGSVAYCFSYYTKDDGKEISLFGGSIPILEYDYSKTLLEAQSYDRELYLQLLKEIGIR